ncbi:MAG: DUF1877 family protein [Actinomycetaceae bacterium]|nr:DUF1877 family protein [Actinomycetaceae bacterium]
MSLYAEHLAIPTKEFQRIQATRGNLFDLWEKLSENKVFPRSVIGESWLSLHFVLTGKIAVFPLEGSVLSQAIMGADTLISLVDSNTHLGSIPAEKIPPIVAELDKVNIEVLFATADFSQLATAQICSDLRPSEDPTELGRHLQVALKNLQAFYRKATEKNYGVLVAIS